MGAIKAIKGRLLMSFCYYDYFNEETAYFLTSGEQYFSYIRHGNKFTSKQSFCSKHMHMVITLKLDYRWEY